MKIALVGLDSLNSLGFKYLIQNLSNGYDIEIYDNATDSGWEQADCHIVSAAALALAARYLMPRLDRVLLVTTSAMDNAPMNMVSPHASRSQLLQAVMTMLGNAINPVQDNNITTLTSREIDVLRLTATGKTSKQIADKLCISQNTVLTHRKNIATKTGLHTVSAITHFAMVHGLLH